jgi:hypothetical protein
MKKKITPDDLFQGAADGKHLNDIFGIDEIEFAEITGKIKLFVSLERSVTGGVGRYMKYVDRPLSVPELFMLAYVLGHHIAQLQSVQDISSTRADVMRSRATISIMADMLGLTGELMNTANKAKQECEEDEKKFFEKSLAEILRKSKINPN